MSEVTVYLLVIIALLLTHMWLVVRINALFDMTEQLQSSLAAIADGKATIYRTNGKIVITHKED